MQWKKIFLFDMKKTKRVLVAALALLAAFAVVGTSFIGVLSYFAR